MAKRKKKASGAGVEIASEEGSRHPQPEKEGISPETKDASECGVAPDAAQDPANEYVVNPSARILELRLGEALKGIQDSYRFRDTTRMQQYYVELSDIAIQLRSIGDWQERERKTAWQSLWGIARKNFKQVSFRKSTIKLMTTPLAALSFFISFAVANLSQLHASPTHRLETALATFPLGAFGALKLLIVGARWIRKESTAVGILARAIWKALWLVPLLCGTGLMLLLVWVLLSDGVLRSNSLDSLLTHASIVGLVTPVLFYLILLVARELFRELASSIAPDIRKALDYLAVKASSQTTANISDCPKSEPKL